MSHCIERPIQHVDRFNNFWYPNTFELFSCNHQTCFPVYIQLFKRNFTDTVCRTCRVRGFSWKIINLSKLFINKTVRTDATQPINAFRTEGEAIQGAKAHAVIGRKELLAHCWNVWYLISETNWNRGPLYFHITFTFYDFEIYCMICWQCHHIHVKNACWHANKIILVLYMISKL